MFSTEIIRFGSDSAKNQNEKKTKLDETKKKQAPNQATEFKYQIMRYCIELVPFAAKSQRTMSHSFEEKSDR